MGGKSHGTEQIIQDSVSFIGKGKSTAPELAKKFEVSIRTIYRDLDTISAAGVPIYATQGRGGGIFIMSDFVLNKSLLS